MLFSRVNFWALACVSVLLRVLYLELDFFNMPLLSSLLASSACFSALLYRVLHLLMVWLRLMWQFLIWLSIHLSVMVEGSFMFLTTRSKRALMGLGLLIVVLVLIVSFRGRLSSSNSMRSAIEFLSSFRFSLERMSAFRWVSMSSWFSRSSLGGFTFPATMSTRFLK